MKSHVQKSVWAAEFCFLSSKGWILLPDFSWSYIHAGNAVICFLFEPWVLGLINLLIVE